MSTKVIRFTASWCSPCKVYGPIFDRVAAELGDVEFVTYTHEDNREQFEKYGVIGIPLTVVEVDDVVVFAQSGIMRDAELKREVSRSIALSAGGTVE